MRGLRSISLATVAAAAACLAAAVPAPVLAGASGEMTVDGQKVQVLVIWLDGQRKFTAFVRPNTVARSVALKAASIRAWPLCRDHLGAHAMRAVKMERRSWAVPLDWRIDGICE